MSHQNNQGAQNDDLASLIASLTSFRGQANTGTTPVNQQQAPQQGYGYSGHDLATINSRSEARPPAPDTFPSAFNSQYATQAQIAQPTVTHALHPTPPPIVPTPQHHNYPHSVPYAPPSHIAASPFPFPQQSESYHARSTTSTPGTHTSNDTPSRQKSLKSKTAKEKKLDEMLDSMQPKTIKSSDTALRYVERLVERRPPVLERFHKMINTQHSNELDWAKQRQVLLDKQSKRAIEAEEVQARLRAINVPAAFTQSADTLASENAQELRNFDLKVHHALRQLYADMSSQLAMLGIPFFDVDPVSLGLSKEDLWERRRNMLKEVERISEDDSSSVT